MTPAYIRQHGPLRTLRDFAGQLYLVFDRDRAMLREWWRAAFDARTPLPERVACQIRSIEELLALAEAAIGIAVLPRYSVAAALEAGRVEQVHPRVARDAIHLAWRRSAVETARFVLVRNALSQQRAVL